MSRNPDAAGPPGLSGNPDRLRWNAKYAGDFVPSFAPHPLAEQALSLSPPAGPVLDLACGASGSALYLAAAGRRVTAVDVSDVALGLLTAEAARRGLTKRIIVVQADLASLRLQPPGWALVLCTGFWDAAVFRAAAAAVMPGGLIGWEALTTQARALRPGLPKQWCVTDREPASLLPPGFAVVEQRDMVSEHSAKRRLLARRAPARRA
jgi:SAM-dependent methyltransferase